MFDTVKAIAKRFQETKFVAPPLVQGLAIGVAISVGLAAVGATAGLGNSTQSVGSERVSGTAIGHTEKGFADMSHTEQVALEIVAKEDFWGAGELKPQTAVDTMRVLCKVAASGATEFQMQQALTVFSDQQGIPQGSMQALWVGAKDSGLCHETAASAAPAQMAADVCQVPQTSYEVRSTDGQERYAVLLDGANTRDISLPHGTIVQPAETESMADDTVTVYYQGSIVEIDKWVLEGYPIAEENCQSRHIESVAVAAPASRQATAQEAFENYEGSATTIEEYNAERAAKGQSTYHPIEQQTSPENAAFQQAKADRGLNNGAVVAIDTTRQIIAPPTNCRSTPSFGNNVVGVYSQVGESVHFTQQSGDWLLGGANCWIHLSQLSAS